MPQLLGIHIQGFKSLANVTLGQIGNGKGERLYHKLLEELAREFRRHAEKSKWKIQMLLTTHSPYFVDALTPRQVWLMEKDEKGHTQVKRTADMPAIEALEEEGIPLGSLWYSSHFEEGFGQDEQYLP